MNLKTIRKQRNMRQEDIARYLNVKQATYSGYESGKYEPTIETLCRLADYYNVSVDYLIGREWNNDIGYLTTTQIECVNRYPDSVFPGIKAPIGWLRGHLGNYYSFVQCVANNEEPFISFKDGAYVQLVLEKAYLSDTLKKEVTVND